MSTRWADFCPHGKAAKYLARQVLNKNREREREIRVGRVRGPNLGNIGCSLEIVAYTD